MTAPKILDWQDNANTSNGNPWNVNFPGHQVGDLLLAFVGTYQSATAFATPAGWTQLASTTAHGDLFKVMYQFATSTGGQSWPTNGGLEVATIYKIGNAKPATAPIISSAVTGTGTSADPASISPGSTKDWLYITGLGVAAYAWPTAMPSGYSSQQGWTEGDYSYNTSGQNVVTASYKQTTATSTENPGAWPFGAPQSFATYTVAVEPDPNAVSIIQRGQNSSTPGAGAGPTIAVTPTAGGAGHMYLCAIGSTYNGGGGVSTLTGGGLTWTKVRDNASDASMVSIWKATGTLTTATITATYISSNAYDRHIAVFEVLGTTTIGQQVYTAGNTGGSSSSMGVNLGLFGPASNRPFAAAASGNFSGGTSSILLSGDYEELHVFNGYDSSLEAGGGAYFGWVTGWSPYSQASNPIAYDQSGYGSQYIAITALELGTPWAPPQPVTQVTTGTTAYMGGAGHRRIDYCQNGVWWTTLIDASTGRPCFFYSTDGCLTWTRQTAMNFTTGQEAAMFIDKDDYMHVVYTIPGPTYGAPALKYRRGTPNANRTSYTWSSEVTPYSGYGSGELANYGIGFSVGHDVIAFKDGTGYQVFICYTIADSSGYYYHQLTRMPISSGGTFTPDAESFTGMGGTTGAQGFGALDFRHTAADDKAVQASTPSVYWAFCHIDASHYVMYRKIIYSAGDWTPDAAGEQYINGYGAGYQAPSIAYDGSGHILLGYGLNGDYRVFYTEIPEASPGSPDDIQPPDFPSGTYVLSWSVGYGADGNPYLLASQDGTNDLQMCIYNRGTSTWGAWTTIYSGSVSQITTVRRQGPAATGGIFPVFFTEYAPSPDVFYTTLLVSGSFTLQSAEFSGWGIPIFTTAGVAPTVDTFYPSEDGHVRSVATGGTYTSARNGTATFTVDTTGDGSGFLPWGQAGPGNPGVYECFFAFDTSSIPDGDIIDSVVFSLNIFIDNTASVTNVCEVRAHTWTAPITSSTFVTGASFAGKTLLATATSAPGSRFTASAYKDFTSTGSFAGAINKTGLTQMVVCTDRFTAGTSPGDDETIHPYYVEKGTTFRPKLVVTHHA